MQPGLDEAMAACRGATSLVVTKPDRFGAFPLSGQRDHPSFQAQRLKPCKAPESTFNFSSKGSLSPEGTGTHPQDL